MQTLRIEPNASEILKCVARGLGRPSAGRACYGDGICPTGRLFLCAQIELGVPAGERGTRSSQIEKRILHAGILVQGTRTTY